MLKKQWRWVWVLLGTFSLAVGFVGIFLPLLPTTPFLLLTAYCYGRGSPRLHGWLMAHPHFGPAILDWNERRVIRPRAKWAATTAILCTMAFPLFVVPNILPAVRGGAAACSVAVLVFIWMQKSE